MLLPMDSINACSGWVKVARSSQELGEGWGLFLMVLTFKMAVKPWQAARWAWSARATDIG